jgi:Flp pilus assembly pilin Flp
MASARTRGQGMTEYILIVGLIAILLVGAVVGLRRSMGSAFGAMTSSIEQIGASVSTPTASSDGFQTRNVGGSNASLLDDLRDADGDGIDDRTQR